MIEVQERKNRLESPEHLAAHALRPYSFATPYALPLTISALHVSFPYDKLFHSQILIIMRIIRYTTPKRKPGYGWLLDNKVGPIKGDIFGSFERGEARTSLDSVQLLAPVQPGKIVCVARNYAAHAAEHNAPVPELPALFFKPTSALIGPGQAIMIPPRPSRWNVKLSWLW